MPLTSPTRSPSPYTVTDAVWYICEDPNEPKTTGTITLGALVAGFRKFADDYYHFKGEIERACEALKQYHRGHLGVLISENRKQLASMKDIQRIRTLCIGHFGGELAVETLEELLATLIRKSKIGIDKADAMTLGEVADALEETTDERRENALTAEGKHEFRDACRKAVEADPHLESRLKEIEKLFSPLMEEMAELERADFASYGATGLPEPYDMSGWVAYGRSLNWENGFENATVGKIKDTVVARFQLLRAEAEVRAKAEADFRATMEANPTARNAPPLSPLIKPTAFDDNIAKRITLYECIRNLKPKTELEILAFLETPQGKDVREMVEADLVRQPVTRQEPKRNRTRTDVVRAALRATYPSQKPKQSK